MMATSNDLLTLTANTIRGLSMDAVQKANSGHPGMPMGMADVASVLWTQHLRYSLEDPMWPGRDRFVLSAGHGSMLQYALLHLAGFPLSLDDLKNFRQFGSATPGHPEYGDTVGVETTTGPLGQGFATGVGMALAACMEAERFKNPQYQNRVVGIVSDGDLMEGLSSEASSLAGHLGLGNLVYFYDDNNITIEGDTDLAFSEDVRGRFTAMGWHVLQTDGHDLQQIATVMQDAFAQRSKPTLVICKTHIAMGSPNKQDSAGAHGAPLGAEEIALTKKALGMSKKDFFVPKEVRGLFQERATHNEEQRRQWLQDADRSAADQFKLAQEHQAFRQRQVPDNLLQQLLLAVGDEAGATRALSGKVIQKAAALVPSLVGGSADLDPSTKTRIKDSSSVTKSHRSGRNLHFGIREHAMGSILNGMALHGGFLPMGSTFMVFSDYMRPAIRLAALMGLPVGFIFTHDSLMVGEDGPTHQPVEHAAVLRMIPNLHLWRPADGAEVAAAWTAVLTRRDGPVTLSLTRQNLPALQRPAGFQPEDMQKGAYILNEPLDEAEAVVLCSGSEVATTLEAAKILAAEDIHLRVVSMPCMEAFLAQDQDYRKQVLGTGLTVLAVEMGRPEIWCQFTGSLDRVVGQSSFGKSAPAGELAEHFGFTAAKVAARLRKVL